MKIVLAIPPLTQFNSPYPSTGYLLKYLRSLGHDVSQVDLSLELILQIFSSEGLNHLYLELVSNSSKSSKEVTYYVENFLKNFEHYVATIDTAIKLLQGQVIGSKTLEQICSRKYFPEFIRFAPLGDKFHFLDFHFAQDDLLSRAKYLASLYIDDLSDVITYSIDRHFGLSRYGEKLAQSMKSFNPLLKRLSQNTLIDEFYFDVLNRLIAKTSVDVVGFSAPFSGNVYGALKGSQYLKKVNPHLVTILGGGYVNTELKFLSDKRFFNIVDYLIFGDGEKPLDLLLGQLKSRKEIKPQDLLRTWFVDKEHDTIQKGQKLNFTDVAFKHLSGPSFDGLDFDRYLSMIEYPNPMMRYWTDYKWNKIIVAHGCYWKQCTFCDTSLDYINRYEPGEAKNIVHQMEKLIEETGVHGFHLVDEAAPPVILKSMAKEILQKKLAIEWWGNIRFDEAFTFDITQLLAASGLTAVSGGLEVASDRVLKLISKGVSIEQVARVTKNFRDANILVHAYLMYGFPTQTAQETIDSLEVVRQLFICGCITSGYWHRFSATIHSPVGQNPQKYKIRIKTSPTPKEGIFAINDLDFEECDNKTDHDQLGIGLKKALYNYQLGIGLDFPLQEWFDFKIPATKLEDDYIAKFFRDTRKK